MKFIIVDVKKCTGCRCCELICAATKENEFIPAKSRIKVVNFSRDGVSVPNVCLQCRDNPACQQACPVDAISVTKYGALIINPDLCIECGKCVEACPYGMIEMEEGGPIKCDLCGGNPKCVEYCSAKALKYSELEGSLKEKYQLQLTISNSEEKSPAERRFERSLNLKKYYTEDGLNDKVKQGD
jgi:Fe-S-cluster-containing hydrogenase component 2